MPVIARRKTVYLAAAFTEIEEMRSARKLLFSEFGWEVTSTWIDSEPGTAPLGLAELTDPPDDADRETRIAYVTRKQRAARAARHNLIDLLRADMVMLFTDIPSTSGGYHTELGLALASHKMIFIIGPRLNVFHTLPTIVQFSDMNEFVLGMKEDDELCHHSDS